LLKRDSWPPSICNNRKQNCWKFKENKVALSCPSWIMERTRINYLSTCQEGACLGSQCDG
jgi:hypothetical protein